jgi:hypothetical protein
VAQITETMTVGEAAPLWWDARRVLLKRWSEMFGVPLNEFQVGHIRTYEQERVAEKVSYAQIQNEILGLLSVAAYNPITYGRV